MSMYDDPNKQPAWASDYTSGTPTSTESTNSADRWALIALAVSLTVVLSCVPGFTCLAPLIVGIVALMQARNAANPDRARTYGWIATGIGIVILLAGLVIITLYGAAILAALGELQ